MFRTVNFLRKSAPNSSPRFQDRTPGSSGSVFHCSLCDEFMPTFVAGTNRPTRSHIAAHVADFETHVWSTNQHAKRGLNIYEQPLLFSGSTTPSHFNDHLCRADGSPPSFVDDKATSVANFEMTSLTTLLCRSGGLAGLESSSSSSSSSPPAITNTKSEESTATRVELVKQLPFVYRGEKKKDTFRTRKIATTIIINNPDEYQLSYAFMAVLRDTLSFCSSCPTLGNATVLVLCPREVLEDCSTYCRRLQQKRDHEYDDLVAVDPTSEATLLSSVASNVTLAFLPAYTSYSMCHIAHELFSVSGNRKRDLARHAWANVVVDKKGADESLEDCFAEGEKKSLKQKGAVIFCSAASREEKSLDLALPPPESCRGLSPPIVFRLSQLDCVLQTQRRLCMTKLRQSFMEFKK